MYRVPLCALRPRLARLVILTLDLGEAASGLTAMGTINWCCKKADTVDRDLKVLQNSRIRLVILVLDLGEAASGLTAMGTIHWYTRCKSTDTADRDSEVL